MMHSSGFIRQAQSYVLNLDSCYASTATKVDQMCEFTVYVDGHDDSNIVATSVIKTVVKPDCIVLMNTAGKVVKVPNARITRVDTIMTELLIETCEA